MDKLYRVVIIDDDEFSADNLCLELKKYNRLSIDGMARNGVNGRKLLEKVHPDLLFLDVELPDMKGMELLEQIKGAITWNMQIVFYTAYDKYMIYAIRGAAFDLLEADRQEGAGRDYRPLHEKGGRVGSCIFGYSCACAFGRRAYLYDIHAYQ